MIVELVIVRCCVGCARPKCPQLKMPQVLQVGVDEEILG